MIKRIIRIFFALQRVLFKQKKSVLENGIKKENYLSGKYEAKPSEKYPPRYYYDSNWNSLFEIIRKADVTKFKNIRFDPSKPHFKIPD